MQSLRLLICFTLLLTIVSCQKEIDWGTTPSTGTGSGGSGGGSGSGGSGGSGGGTGNLLVKVVAKQGADSTVETFGYNSANKLISHNNIGKSGGVSTDQKETFTRDAQNRIVQIRNITVVPTLPGFPLGGTIDTTYTNVFYNGTDTKILCTKTTSKQFGIVYEDSVAYVYSGSNVVRTKLFIKVPFIGYAPNGETAYTYDSNGNLTNVKEYGVGVTTVDLERKYTYDTKVSPIVLGPDAVLISQEGLSGSNNAISSQMIDYVSGAGNLTSTTVITYRTNNTPASATGTVLQGGVSTTGTATYYYQ